MTRVIIFNPVSGNDDSALLVFDLLSFKVDIFQDKWLGVFASWLPALVGQSARDL